MTPAPAEHRFSGLDGLRAVAVAMVVWHNFGALPLTGRFGHAGELRAGYVGVTVFFTISGFLITHLLVEEVANTGRIRVIAFYVRRAFRLFPALFLTLALLIATAIVRDHPGADIMRATVATVAYVFNFAAAHSPVDKPFGGAGWGHLWSLSVEEQFYLAWPLGLAFAIPRFSPRRMAIIITAAIATIAIWRTILWARGASFFRLYLFTDVRVDAMLLGAALAIALREFPSTRIVARRLRRSLVPALLGLVLIASRGSGASPAARPGWLLGPGMVLVSLLSALIIIILVTDEGGSAQRVLDSAAFRAIGRRSYGIYLFHYPIEALVGDRAGGWFLAVAGTALATELSYRFVEVPALRRLPARFRRAAYSGRGQLNG